MHENQNIKQIVISVSNKMLGSVKISTENTHYDFKFSDLKIGIGIKANLYNYSPPVNAQVVTNPLNN